MDITISLMQTCTKTVFIRVIRAKNCMMAFA